MLINQPFEIVEPEVVKHRLDATIIGQRQQDVHRLRTTVSPLGRDHDGPLQNPLGGSRSRQPSEHKLIAHTDGTNGRRMHVPSGDAALAEQIADPPAPAPREGKQEMLGPLIKQS